VGDGSTRVLAEPITGAGMFSLVRLMRQQSRNMNTSSNPLFSRARLKSSQGIRPITVWARGRKSPSRKQVWVSAAEPVTLLCTPWPAKNT
jgi:hypothetical protein